MTFSNKMVLNWNGNYRFAGKNEKGLTVSFDAPLFFGGEESAPSPMENVLASIAACSSIHIVSLLIEQEQKIIDYSVEITGERKEEPPRTFVAVQIKYIIKGKNINEEIVKNAITDSQDNYWSVGTMLKKAVPITSSFEIVNI
jgi:putative redox protein